MTIAFSCMQQTHERIKNNEKDHLDNSASPSSQDTDIGLEIVDITKTDNFLYFRIILTGKRNLGGLARYSNEELGSLLGRIAIRDSQGIRFHVSFDSNKLITPVLDYKEEFMQILPQQNKVTKTRYRMGFGEALVCDEKPSLSLDNNEVLDYKIDGKISSVDNSYSSLTRLRFTGSGKTVYRIIKAAGGTD